MSGGSFFVHLTGKAHKAARPYPPTSHRGLFKRRSIGYHQGNAKMDGAMTRSLTVALAALLTLSACGAVRDSRLNPFNWFGRSEPVETIRVVEKADPRPLIGDVLSMSVEAYSSGVIVRATGRTETQGWWDAELIEAKTDDPSKLVLEFRLLPPIVRTDVNTPRSREVTDAKTLSPTRLEYITSITVQGANNARATRR
jgi:hypothetical protein